MQPDLKDCATRLSLYVLNLLDEIRSAPRDVDPQETRANILALFALFDQGRSPTETFQLAKYALCAWIDESLIRADWPHAAGWKARPLEKDLFGTECRSWRFFELAEIARQRRDREALQVFRFCVAFGFRGIYGGNPVKVRLNDPLPMRRVRAAAPVAVPVLAGSLAADDWSNAPLDSAEKSFSRNESPKPFLRKDVPSVLPPTLSEWTEFTFGEFPSREKSPAHTLWDVFAPTDAAKHWAIVMAIGGLLSAMLFAIGH